LYLSDHSLSLQTLLSAPRHPEQPLLERVLSLFNLAPQAVVGKGVISANEAGEAEISLPTGIARGR
jgi:hypothetical protein